MAAPKNTSAPTFEQRAQELARRGEELKARQAERNALEAATNSATSARQRAHETISHIIDDPMSFSATPHDELELHKKLLLDADQLEKVAHAKLAAHFEEHGDLGAEAKKLSHESQCLAQERLLVDDRADVVEMISLGEKLRTVSRRMEERRQFVAVRWPEREVVHDGLRVIEKRAGLKELGFMPGIFVPLDNGFGSKSAWVDDVLVGFARAYPDIQLPAEHTTVATHLERIKNGVPQWHARVAWSQAPYLRLRTRS